MSELTTATSALPGLPGVLSRTGWRAPGGMSFDDWLLAGNAFKAMEQSVLWWIGDWLAFGEKQYGETYSQALDATDYSYQTVANAKYVADRIQFSRRRENLSFSHHAEVAALPPGEQDEWLDSAVNHGWSRNALRRELNRHKNGGGQGAGDTGIIAALHEAVAQGLRFGTVYADPPWQYDNQGTRAATGNHYNGMTVEQICELPIKDLASPDAHLHLWTTNGFLFECPRIFEAWGFEFKSSFVWCKSEIGIGNYWRNAHEILLTAVRGDAKRFDDKSLRSWLETSRGVHSAKPEQVRGFIERASPGPYLELFARSPARGWRVWGNAVERGLLFQDVDEAAA